MNFDNVKTALSRVRLQRNVALAVGAMMLGVNATLGVALVSQSNQVVLVPTNVSDGMVARGAFDKRYVESLALDAVYALYNASPSNIRYGRSVIERLGSVKDRNSLLKYYDEVSQDMKERDITTVFFPTHIEHNIDALQVIVEGDLQIYLSTVPTQRHPRKVLLTFVTEAGSIRLSKVGLLEADS